MKHKDIGKYQCDYCKEIAKFDKDVIIGICYYGKFDGTKYDIEHLFYARCNNKSCSNPFKYEKSSSDRYLRNHWLRKSQNV